MPPSPNDSVVLVGDRKTLPHVYVDSASETGYVRHRSSGGSESGCMTPTSRDNQVANTPQSQFRNRYGTPGCVQTLYQQSPRTLGSSVFDQDMSASPCKGKRPDAAINIDSGFADNYSSKSKVRRNLSTDLWDSVLKTPVNNLKNKLKKRPSFVDETKYWSLDTEQVLGWIIFSLILFSLLLAVIMTYSAFVGPKVQYNNGKYDSIKHAAKDRYDPDAPSLLLEDDVTMEEVLEFKRVLEDDNGNEEVLIEKDYIYQDIYRQEEFQKTFLEPNTLRDQNRESDVMSQRLQQAEELLEKESKLMIEVSKKLEMFIEESKQRIAEDEPSDLSESIDKEIDIVKTVAEASVIAQPIQTKPKKGKKSKNTNPLLPAIPKDPKSRVRVQLQDKLGEAMVQANNVDEVLLDDDSDVNDREKRAGRSNLIKMNRFRKHYDDMNDFYLRSQENDVKRGDNKAKKNGRDDSD